MLVVLMGPGLADDLCEHPTIRQLYHKNNSVRKKKGLAEQKLSPELTKAAQDQAWYMARQHDKGEEDFNHRGGNGSPGQRAAKAGYCGLVKENIARGYLSVDKTFDAWLDSEEHRGAIYSSTSDVGFGYAIAKDGTTYWVGLYGEPKCSKASPSPSSNVPIPSSLASWWVSNP
jgi:uncharacterized protein YkwD